MTTEKYHQQQNGLIPKHHLWRKCIFLGGEGEGGKNVVIIGKPFYSYLKKENTKCEHYHLFLQEHLQKKFLEKLKEMQLHECCYQ